MSLYPLPDFARSFLEHQLQGRRSALKSASQALSQSYRQQQPARHLAEGERIPAYLATRLPATYAAVSAVLHELKLRQPDWQPASMLDLGAGPGTASLAASQLFRPLSFSLYEQERAMLELGKGLFAQGPETLQRASWQQGSLPNLPKLPSGSAELVLMAYVLNELPAQQRQQLYQNLQASQAEVLVAVEPGTPAGYQHILELRSQFLSWGWQIWAPCPHHQACPLAAPDWCHFAQRLSRSALQRELKQAELNFEDEKFSYLILSRKTAAQTAPARILRHPQKLKGHVELKLCTASAQQQLSISRKSADYKAARKAAWGDSWPPQARLTEF